MIRRSRCLVVAAVTHPASPRTLATTAWRRASVVYAIAGFSADSPQSLSHEDLAVHAAHGLVSEASLAPPYIPLCVAGRTLLPRLRSEPRGFGLRRNRGARRQTNASRQGQGEFPSPSSPKESVRLDP